MTEIEDFESRFESSGALHGFGFAEMPPVIFGGKGEARHRPLKAGGVNNHWNVTEIEDFKKIISRAGLCVVSSLTKCRRSSLAARAKQTLKCFISCHRETLSASHRFDDRERGWNVVK